MIGGLQKVGFGMIVIGNTGLINKSPNPLSVDIIKGDNSNKYAGRCLSISVPGQVG